MLWCADALAEMKNSGKTVIPSDVAPTTNRLIRVIVSETELSANAEIQYIRDDLITFQTNHAIS